MSVKLKILILLAALAALPLRGLAAVAMWHCAQDRHQQAMAADAHDGEHGAHAEHGAEHGAGLGHAGEDNDAPAESQGTPTTSSCSACAACCVGGAVAPSAWTSFSLEPPGASAIAFVERSFTGVVPAQLERPPLAPSR